MAPSITIVVPALNEEQYIAGCLASLLPQAAATGAEIVVFDGGSTDRTRQIVRAMTLQHGTLLRLVDNPRRIQSAAVNLAALASAAPVLLRADAHASYPADFVDTVFAAMTTHGATSVVVPMITRGNGGFQNAVAAAQNSRLGNGGSRHRTAGVSGFVEHGHHAAFDRQFFLRVGGYDESFTHNEDAELDQRALQHGGRIWMCVDAPVTYYPRAALWPLIRQYVRHGRGRAMMLHKHRLRPRLRQLAPVFALAAVVLGLVLAPLQPLFLLLPALYVAACLAVGAMAGVRSRDPWQACSGVAAIAMHLGWAVGFIAGSVQAWSRPAEGAVRAAAAR